MGIEDPGWSKVIIVIAFLAFMILTLYYVKGQGRGLITKLHQNKLLSIEETIASVVAACPAASPPRAVRSRTACTPADPWASAPAARAARTSSPSTREISVRASRARA